MEKSNKTKHDLLKEIRDEVLDGNDLPLFEERTKNKVYPVIGEGSHDARIMFIGEAPGRNEAATGRPFCGTAGKILDELLISAGLKREEVYITNIVKDRPPRNRDPLPEEIRAYAPFLTRQIEIIQPSVLATLGRYSMNFILETFNLWEELAPISKLHGKVFEANASHGAIKIVALYHPAAAVYNRTLLDTLKKDFLVLKNI
ncbi:MAG: uracil-DNA glycosylase [Parcubacteria group bacterium]|nr:uracil-DNA glycosylase [Parcubacteria group bacterium]